MEGIDDLLKEAVKDAIVKSGKKKRFAKKPLITLTPELQQMSKEYKDKVNKYNAEICAMMLDIELKKLECKSLSFEIFKKVQALVGPGIEFQFNSKTMTIHGRLPDGDTTSEVLETGDDD